MATAAPTTPLPELPWDDFRAGVFRWRQGEHLSLIGPTGCGKTTLARELLTDPDRRHVAVFATKRQDPVIEDFASRGFVKLPRWNVSDPELLPRVVIAPKTAGLRQSIAHQHRVFAHALDSAFRQGGWCLYFDEARYLTDFLRLGRDAEMLWQTARSAGVTVVAGVQRPRHVPLVAFDQATHHFYWRTADVQMLRRLGELCGNADPEAVRAGISSLDSHSMIYVNTVSGESCRTRVPVELAR